MTSFDHEYSLLCLTAEEEDAVREAEINAEIDRLLEDAAQAYRLPISETFADCDDDGLLVYRTFTPSGIRPATQEEIESRVQALRVAVAHQDALRERKQKRREELVSCE